MAVYFPVDIKGKESFPEKSYKSCYSMLKTIASLTRLSLAFLGAQGEQISPSENIHKFCHLIHKKAPSSQVYNECVEFHRQLFEKAKSTGQLAVSRCPMGLKSFVLPVIPPGEDIAFYIVGGHFVNDISEVVFPDEDLLPELSPEEIKEALGGTAILDEKQFQAVLKELGKIAKLFAEQTKREQQEKRVSRVVNFISELAKKFKGRMTLKELLLSIVNKLSEVFDVEKCAIALFDDTRRFIEVFASNDEYADEIFGGKVSPGSGATGIVASTGKTLYSYDAKNDPRLESSVTRNWRISSLLSLPLKLGGGVIGVMHLVSQESPRKYTEKDIEYAEALATEISLLVESARLYNESKRRAREIAKSRDEIKTYFKKLGAALSASLDLKQLLKLFVELSIHLTHADGGSIFLVEDKKISRYVAVTFEKGNEKENITKTLKGSLPVYTDRDFTRKKFKPGEIKAYLGIPLERKGNVKGVLNIYDREPRDFTTEEVELLSIFAGHASIAIENARQFFHEKKKAKEASSLYQAAKVIGESVSLDEVLNRSVEQLTKVAGVDRCLLLLLDYKKLELYTAAEKGLSEDQKNFFTFFRIPIDEIDDELWESLIRGKPVKLPETTEIQSAFKGFFDMFPTSSGLLVPLLSKEQLTGVIFLDDSRMSHTFEESQIRLIMTLTIQIASAIQRATLVNQMENNLDQLKALHQVSTGVTGTLSLSRVFTLVVDKASHLIDAPAASMLAWDEGRKEYILQARKGLSDELEGEEFHKLISEKTAKRRRYITYYVSADSEGEDSLIYQTLKSASMGGYVSVPLIARKRVVGVLNCFCKEGDKFDSQEIRLLRSFANQAAIAVENARLYAIIKNKVRELATVFEVGKSITSTLNLNEVLNEINSSVVRTMEADAASIMLLDEEHQELKIIQTLGLGKYHQGETIKVGAGIAGIAAKIGRHMVLHDEEGKSSTYKFPQRVRQDGLRTILSVPMRVRDKIIGLLNIYKKVVYHFSPAEINLVTTLANQAAIAIENARLYNEQYNIAQIIRQNLMPRRKMEFEGIDVGHVYVPSEILSGDYFEVINLGHNRYGMVISDVSGKGTPAAIYNARAKYVIRSYAIADYSPADILTLLNHMMEEETAIDKFISVLYLDLDVESFEVFFSSAGHEPLILWDNSEKEAKVFEKSNLPIGVLPDTVYDENFFTVGKGDIIVLYTDGITEARSRDGEFFGIERLVQIVRENFHLSAQVLANKIHTSIQKFTRRKFTDDVSLLVVKI